MPGGAPLTVSLPATERSVDQKQDQDRRPQPRYHVRLWDDNQHTFLYVIRMLRDLFGYSLEHAQRLAVQVDSQGSAVCFTTTREHAELKREQILAYGRDALVAGSLGSMSCSIEPEQ